jgi:hypothetical protein
MADWKLILWSSWRGWLGFKVHGQPSLTLREPIGIVLGHTKVPKDCFSYRGKLDVWFIELL